MLSSMVKEHQARQSARKEAQEIKRKEAVQAASELTQALVDHLNVGVAQAYLNQKKLDAEAKQLHVSATNFSKQTQQWVNLIESFSSSLKELGDVENWAKTIEGDVRTITQALDIVYKASQEAQSQQS
ncbi:biogenesis of lysosome-related organelles complex 1 subunit 1-like [Agrilus planipennis]|uniref:Biogenesis of lysosome-related organelles complex 1 subunit 1 n=1 Tax=Agrilus planipennis TaxID=224129 RepID=A0A1W4X1B6_AGRPL|nr:biogenesis of lysosome-related organelles complex 1 subunit 1 [Agrilus planipennis]XP_025834083.1 biogenesis of lysosome-related organelles complex 1 subunit 1-like [Agrilus planipennis]